MSQLIVGLHAGYHDPSAVVFEAYTFKAAVQLERLTRIKGDASKFPYRCIEEVLSIVIATSAQSPSAGYIFPMKSSSTAGGGALIALTFVESRSAGWQPKSALRARSGEVIDSRKPCSSFGYQKRRRSISMITMKPMPCRRCFIQTGTMPCW